MEQRFEHQNTFDLEEDASLAEIYKEVIRANIEQSLMKIPSELLEQLHTHLKNDVIFEIPLPKQDSRRNMQRDIEDYYQQAKRSNNEVTHRNLTFDTWTYTRGRYAQFKRNIDESRAERVTVVNSTDVTLSSMRHAVGHFGEDFCFKLTLRGITYSSSLANKAVDSSVSFQSLMRKGILHTKNIYVTDLVEYEILPMEIIYCNPIKATLLLHQPYNITCLSSDWEFVREICIFRISKGHREIERRVMNLTFARLKSSSSKFKATARAEYQFDVTKGYKMDTLLQIFSLGIGWALGQEETKTFDSEKFQLEFRCCSDFFKLKSKPEINISLEAARSYFSMSTELHQLQGQLGKEREMKKLESNSREVIADVQSMEEQTAESELISEVLNSAKQELHAACDKPASDSKPWIMSLVVNGMKKDFNVQIVTETEHGLRKYFLEVKSFEQAAGHITKGLKDTVLKKYELVLNNNPSDFNNMAGFLFEEVVNAKVMREAAKVGVPIEIIEGDGRGLMMNAAGEKVPTPEFVDVVFHNKDTGDKHNYQYKFSDTASNVEEMEQSWRRKWELKGEDLKDVEVAAPKGTGSNNSKIKETVKVGDRIEVDCVTHEDMLEYVNNMTETLKKAATEVKERYKDLKAIGTEKTIQKKIGKIKETIDNLNSAIENADSAVHDQIKTIRNKQKEDLHKLESDLIEMERIKEASDNRLNDIFEESGPIEIAGEGKKHAEAKDRLERAEDELKKVKQVKKEIVWNIGLAAGISAATELICSLADEMALYRKGKQTLKEAAVKIFKRTATAAAVGGGVAGVTVGIQYGLTRLALAESSNLATVGDVGSKCFGPALLVAGLGYQCYTIISQYNSDAELSLDFARQRMLRNSVLLGGTTICSIGGVNISAALLGTGPLGLCVGAAVVIAFGVGSHLVGKHLGMKEEEDQLRYEKLKSEVIEAAYKLFDLEKHCTDKELKDAWRARVLKYHPDKSSEDADIFKAVHSAYTLLKTVRAEND